MGKFILWAFIVYLFIAGTNCYAANWHYLVSGEQNYRVLGVSFTSKYDLYIDTDFKRSVDAETIQAWFKYEYHTPIKEEGPNYYYNPVLRSITSALSLDQYKANGQFCTLEQHIYSFSRRQTIIGFSESGSG